MLIGTERDLRLAVGATHARTLDGDTSPAEGHLAVLVAVAHGDAIRVMLALRAHHIVDLLLHQFGKHAQPDTDAQR